MKFWYVQENVRKFLKPAPWLWAASERWAQLRTKPAEKALSWSGQVVTIKSVCVCVWQRVSPSPQHWWCNAQVHSTQPEGLPRPAVLWLVWCVYLAELGSRRLRILGDLLCSFTLGGFYLLSYLGYSFGGVLPSNVGRQEVSALSKPSANVRLSVSVCGHRFLRCVLRYWQSRVESVAEPVGETKSPRLAVRLWESVETEE